MPIKVSVIVPCRNEERTIRLLLEAIMLQSFPREALEIIIADGMSEDGTRMSLPGSRRLIPICA
jgi:glycosyltransferase involved in cell wall biosynthesis